MKQPYLHFDLKTIQLPAAKQQWTSIDFAVKPRAIDRILTSRTTEENADAGDNSFQIDMLLKITCLAYGKLSSLENITAKLSVVNEFCRHSKNITNHEIVITNTNISKTYFTLRMSNGLVADITSQTVRQMDGLGLHIRVFFLRSGA